MDHVIIGNGPAGVIAAETLRRTDPACRVRLIGDEPEPPYSRMALPYLLAGNIEESGTHLRHGKDHWASRGIELETGRVVKLDPGQRRVVLDDGSDMTFDRLLIATGSTPVRPPIPGMDLEGVETCWTLADARRIAAAARPGSDIVLMGAGFIGCIVLEALVARAVNLTIIEMEERMVPRMMDRTGGDMIKRWCEDKGVKVLTSTRVEGLTRKNGRIELALAGGGGVTADGVVCATGVKPNISFFDGSGIETDLGVLVDHHLQTSIEGIHAAGDVAQGPEFFTGKREIHAIQPTASEHGRIAALNMAGRSTRYGGSLSMNVLNTLGLISSSFGQWMGVDGGEETVAADPANGRYLKLAFADDMLVGALALGLTQHVGVIRGLMQSKVRLGHWKERLMRDPARVMEAYLARTQGSSAGY
ncbi:MAG: NAD(P)/FAD-dependent oxidoreductase [Hyphomicrobiales bacterium]